MNKVINTISSLILMLVVIILLLSSCTDNQRTRSFGGVETVELKSGERLVNVTWKQDDLWVLTKQDTTRPSTYTFQEKSSYGVLEGTIVIKEK
jgi:uncharacterized lipoprotein YehR (DUF1307 family)